MDIYTCLQTLVGITREECECITGAPENHDTSLSGYWMDDREWSIPLSIPNDTLECDETDIWQRLEWAREDGLNEMLTNLYSEMVASNSRDAQPWMGAIGEEEHNKVLFQTSGLRGLWFRTAMMKGAKFLITKIERYSSSTPDLTSDIVELYSLSNDFDTPIQAEVMSYTGGKGTIDLSASPWEIKFETESGIQPTYFLLSDLSFNADNVALHCGCGNQFKPWMGLMKVGGVSLNSLSEMDKDHIYGDIYTNGFRVYGQIHCDAFSWLCQWTDWRHNPWAKVFAKTLQLHQIQKLLAGIIESPEVNAYTTVSKEYIHRKMASNYEQMEGRMKWLALHFPYTMSQCFSCSSTIQAKKQALLV